MAGNRAEARIDDVPSFVVQAGRRRLVVVEAPVAPRRRERLREPAPWQVRAVAFACGALVCIDLSYLLLAFSLR